MGIVIGVIVGAIFLFRVSSTPVMVSVFNVPIRDEAVLDRIVMRIEQENVKVNVTPNSIVQVPDEPSARRMRGILVSENLIPSGIDPWQVFDRDRWTLTDFERKVNFRRAQQRMITEHIRAVDGVDDVSISIVWPEKELFRADQNPVSASVILTPTPGSDITTNRKKVEGIQKLIKFAIEGLKDENITISDKVTGLQINDFEGMAEFDRLSAIEKQNKLILGLEKSYRNLILSSLQSTYSTDRVRDLNIKIEMDMSKKTVESTEFQPFIKKARTPGLAYDDSEIMDSVLLSESVSTTTWEGTGYNPEGPAGQEGQAPPAFKDMQNLYGKMTQTTRTHNQEINRQETQEERSPSIDRVAISVNIDGKWKMKVDAKGKPVILPDGSIEREYTPIPDAELRSAETLVRNAIAYNSARGDVVSVHNIPFDRTEQFRLEDEAYFKKKQLQTTIIVFLTGLTLLLFGFIMFRMISREMERRRRLAEEERARREQMLRESAMAEAEQEGMEVSISTEERNRMELMESVINMAKEHPDDAAQLIRTWLIDE
jgi:flagellar M-ring protein FliF